MTKTKGVSPKLAAAVAPPLTAVVTHVILTGKIDRASLALLAAILIGAALGYHAPRGDTTTAAPAPSTAFPVSEMSSVMFTRAPLFDPALDDPAHADDEPEIPDSALTGRHAGSVKQRDHVNLGDPS